jgi:hypothetical protein
MNGADEAWHRYVNTSMAQIHTAAALDEIPDIDRCEQQMTENDPCR